MKIPDIKGHNKIRDAKICALYADGDKTGDELAAQFNLTPRRIRAILYNNRQYLKIDKDWEEAKQIHRIKGRIKRSSDSKKDVYDWEALLHDKINTKRIEHSGEVKVVEMPTIKVGDRLLEYNLG